MAGDWIKMRNNLWDDPRVSQLCDLTESSEAAVVGGLYWLWASADEHTEDGYMPGLTTTGIDRKTGIKGFGAALIQVGWMSPTEGGVTINNFEEHNGTSAKRRCTDAQRKANVRSVSASDADNMRTEQGAKAPNIGAREEKRREDIYTAPDGFDDFWKIYPSKKAKPAALKAFKAAKLNGSLSAVLAHVGLMADSDDWKKNNGQFVPMPATYLNQRRWEDEAAPAATAERFV